LFSLGITVLTITIQDHDEPHDLFVLKAFDASNANEHQKELHTHLGLMKDMANKNITSIIKFYGSYTQAGTFNIVLEYADKGSLDKFLPNNNPPTRQEDVCVFWKSLLDLFQALIYLHNHSEGGMYVVPNDILNVPD